MFYLPYRFTKEQTRDVIPGLEGVNAVATVKSKVDGSGKGALYYLGYNIAELAEKSNYEEVAYLLLHDKLPTIKELDDFKNKLKNNLIIDEKTVDIIKTLDIKDHSLASLRTVVSSLSSFDAEAEDSSEKANEEKSIKLVAQLPVLAAFLKRINEGKEIIRPNPSLSIAENFIYMTTGKEDSLKSKVLDLCLVLHADHSLNASTFVARQCASSESDIYSCVTAAIAALKGPLHGGANQGVIKMLLEIKGDTKTYILEKLSRKEKIMGIGHRVYKGGDPRAFILKRYARELSEKTNSSDLFKKAEEIEKIMDEEKGLKANIDLYSAIVFYCLGIPADMFSMIFAMARISGWTAHILEQYANNRLLRPKSVYVEELAPLNKEYIEIKNRGK